MTAVVPTEGFQAEIVPFRLAKMKSAGAGGLPVPGISNPEPLFATWPVGPWGPLVVVGVPTVRGTFTAVMKVTA